MEEFSVTVDYTELVDVELVLMKHFEDGVVTSYDLTYLDGKKIKYDVKCLSEEAAGEVLQALEKRRDVA